MPTLSINELTAAVELLQKKMNVVEEKSIENDDRYFDLKTHVENIQLRQDIDTLTKELTELKENGPERDEGDLVIDSAGLDYLKNTLMQNEITLNDHDQVLKLLRRKSSRKITSTG